MLNHLVHLKRKLIGLSSEPIVDTPENLNDIPISDAETQSRDEHEPTNNDNDDVHVDAQPSNDNDVEIEPAVDLDKPQPKNKRYDKRDFIAKKHSKEREPWFRNPCLFLIKLQRTKMMKNLSTLLKCLDLLFALSFDWYSKNVSLC